MSAISLLEERLRERVHPVGLALLGHDAVDQMGLAGRRAPDPPGRKALREDRQHLARGASAVENRSANGDLSRVRAPLAGALGLATAVVEESEMEAGA